MADFGPPATRHRTTPPHPSHHFRKARRAHTATHRTAPRSPLAAPPRHPAARGQCVPPAKRHFCQRPVDPHATPPRHRTPHASQVRIAIYPRVQTASRADVSFTLIHAPEDGLSREKNFDFSRPKPPNHARRPTLPPRRTPLPGPPPCAPHPAALPASRRMLRHAAPPPHTPRHPTRRGTACAETQKCQLGRAAPCTPGTRRARGMHHSTRRVTAHRHM